MAAPGPGLLLAKVSACGVCRTVEPMPLAEGNVALTRLRGGRLRGGAVLTMDD